MIEPEDGDCGNASAEQEGVSIAVVTCLDLAPVLEFAEHNLDPMAPSVKHGVVGDRHLAVGLLWDAGGDATWIQGGAQPVGIVATVGQQRRALAIAHLALAEQNHQRSVLTIAGDMPI